ncbi:uncharacterized protein [Nicotiana sylvestris]|uniref:uncharacterized protein n=1 Tax=Nicotiana sylvestris TaxID=4096 RepID=UPI00388CA233
MPFGLKNAGATYQRLVTKMFQEHFGRTMEVYIDDMLVKAQHSGDHISNLSDTFQILREFKMKLNPEKCAFGVASGKFLGFLVSNRGIEVNPAQIKAIEEIPDMLTSEKEVQRLTGRIAALGRFISKSSEKCFKFLSALKKQNQFEWTEDCQHALKNLKTYLSNPPLLAKPKAGERLLIYLAVSEVAVSAVLVREDQAKECNWKQKKNYKCSTKTLFTDGSSNVKGAGLGIVLIPPTGETIRQAIKCHSITNNEAEYEAVIVGLELARELGINQIVIKNDSQLVVNQMLGTYTAREARMQQYLEKVCDLIRQFQTWKVMQISRDENVEVDALANLASVADVASNENASVIHLFHLVLDPDKSEVNFNNLTRDWRNEIVAFLQYGTVPEDKKKAHTLRKKAARYCLKQGNICRKMFGGPLARCIGSSQTKYVMREIHEGHLEITLEEDH